MKIGDTFKMEGKYNTVVCFDLDDDIWFEVFTYGDNGGGLIKDVNNDYERGYLFQVKHEFEYGKRYDYIESSIFRKITLTKLAKKMYNIKEDFTGDFYVLK